MSALNELSDDQQVRSSEFSVVVESQPTSFYPTTPPGWKEAFSVIGGYRVRCVSPTTSTSTNCNEVMITLHDIGLNSGTCFQSFFNYCLAANACKELFYFAHFHLDVLGCEDGADTVNANMSVERLVDGLEEVVKEYSIQHIVGFGVGLGASVMLQFAKLHPRYMRGLILVSPLVFPSGVMERVTSYVSTGWITGMGLGRRLKDGLLARWFSQETIDHNIELVKRFDDAMDRVNATNMACFWYAEACRPDISHNLAKVECRVLLVSGKDSPLRWHAVDSFSMFNRENISWIDVESTGSLVIEERPDEVARALSLFLQGCGWE